MGHPAPASEPAAPLRPPRGAVAPSYDLQPLERRQLLSLAAHAAIASASPITVASPSPSPASSSAAATLNASASSSTGQEIVGYLPDYEFASLKTLDWSALTQINYFSLVANSNGSLPSTSEDGASLSQLSSVVTAAHSASPAVPVAITIDNATPFLTIAASTTATKAFVNNLIAFCATYHLNGIDLDYEPGTLTTAQENSYGSLLAALHAQTSANGLILSGAMQASQMIVPKADIPDLDRYYLMDYDLEYNSSAPYSDSLAYLTNWTNYGVPKSELLMGVPFYGRSGTSWSNSTTDTYTSILSSYAAANNGNYPLASADSVTINGTTWGFNGVDTIKEKAKYVLQNGYGGMMIWELGQDHLNQVGLYDQYSLLTAIKTVLKAPGSTGTAPPSRNPDPVATPAPLPPMPVQAAPLDPGSQGAIASPVAAAPVSVTSAAAPVASPLAINSLPPDETNAGDSTTFDGFLADISALPQNASLSSANLQFTLGRIIY